MGWFAGTLGGRHARRGCQRFIDETWFDRSGNFHSDALHVVERYSRIDAAITSRTKRPSKIRKYSRDPGKSHAAVSPN